MVALCKGNFFEEMKKKKKKAFSGMDKKKSTVSKYVYQTFYDRGFFLAIWYSFVEKKRRMKTIYKL